jgi:hypothetical protein
MAFIQIVEMRTSKIDELTALEEEWRKATDGKRTLRRAIVGQDRTDPSRHLVIAFFDSYESAMQNSNLPETTAFGERQAALLDAPPVFWDLDVVNDDAS